jgi:hypothetical protein
MAQKNATPTKEQGTIIRRHGLNSLFWVVAKDRGGYMVIKHRHTGRIRVISKWTS